MQFFPQSFDTTQTILDNFIKTKINLYYQKRNYDLSPSESMVSYLSPAIARNILSEYDVANRVLKKCSFKDVEKYIQELCWRSYWKGYLKQNQNIWKQYKNALLTLNKNFSSFDHELYLNAIKAKTNIGCFNAWALQLIQTGYLHNHARMWFASIWIHTLKLPWQLGADFFFRYLLDADAASNTLSWRWVAGLHTKGKAYLAKSNNIEKFTKEHFKPTDNFADTALKFEINEAAQNLFETYNKDDFKSDNKKSNSLGDINGRLKNKSKKSVLILHDEIMTCDFPPDFISNFDDIFFISKESLNVLHFSTVVQKFNEICFDQYKLLFMKTFKKNITMYDGSNKNYKDADLFMFKAQLGYIDDAFLSIKKTALNNKITLIKTPIEEKFYDFVFPYCKKGFFNSWKYAKKKLISNLNKVG